MTKITPELFAFACYQVLMNNGRGLVDKNPNYMLEKMQLLEMGWDAFAMLDHPNKRTIVQWLMEWHIDVPGEIRAYLEGVMTMGQIENKSRWWGNKAHPPQYPNF